MAVNAKRENRIKGIVDRVSNEDHYDDVAWITQAPVQVFCRSAVDETAQANAELHNGLGLQAKIRRQTVGENCKWCDNLAGEYDYPGVPQEVFQRHDDCDCIVEYLPGDGRVQDVWSKEWKEDPEDLEARKNYNRDNPKPEVSGKQLENEIDLENVLKNYPQIDKEEAGSIFTQPTPNQTTKDAIDWYVGNGYSDAIDQMLHGDMGEWSESVLGYTRKGSPTRNVTTYRGLSPADAQEISLMESLTPGDRYASACVASTSVDFETAVSFTDYDEKGAIIQYLINAGSKSGAYIQPYTPTKEYEFLMSDNSFVFKGMTMRNVEHNYTTYDENGREVKKSETLRFRVFVVEVENE